MIRIRLKTAAALTGLGLLCGCTSTNTAANPCGEQRQGFLTRMFSGWGHSNTTPCECVETGRMTVGDGPIVPEPGCCTSPGCATQGFPVSTPQGFPMATPQGFPVSTPFAPPSSAPFVPPSSAPFVPPSSTPYVPPMPPPTALPLPGSNPLAQPVPANPSSAVKEAAK